MCLWNTIAPKIANSIDDQDHKDKYFDTSKKILSQEMTMCNIKTIISYFSEIITSVNFLKKNVKCEDQKFKYQQKDLITSNIHVKYQSSSTHFSNVINSVKVFKTYARLQSQGHKVQNVGTHGKVPILKILMWNIKALALTIQMLLTKLKFSKSRSNSKVKVKIVGTH